MPEDRADLWKSSAPAPADAALTVLRRLADAEWTRAGLESLLGGWIGQSLPVVGVRFDWSKEGGDAERRLRVVAEGAPSVHIPMVHRERPLGTLELTLSPAACWDERHASVAEQWGALAAFFEGQRQAVESAERLACRDELTGLFNRRRLREALDEWIPRARRERRPISVLLLDVDHFKAINDAWGHATGDRVLQMIAELLQNSFRAQDVVCRYGGEEFCVLLCDHRADRSKDHPTEALFFAERVRRAAEAMRWTTADGQALAQVTLSGGIAAYPWDGATAQELLQRADEALYAAKRSGRNRIQIARGMRLAG